MEKLLKQLQEGQSSFSPAQRAVAQYITERHGEIPFLTISDVAERTGTSEATVSKFCNELGLSGFSGLKRLIGAHVNSSLSLNSKLARAARSLREENIFERVVSDDVRNIEMTLGNPTNQSNLHPLLDMIDAARNVYTVGARTSAFFADLLAFKLRQQDVNVMNVDFGVGDHVDKMLMIRPGDLVIAFSFSRFTRDVVKMIRMLKEKGVAVVLITGDGLSPAYQYADLVFTCTTGAESYVASYSSVLSLTNLILTARALRHKERVEQYLSELENSLVEFDTFYP